MTINMIDMNAVIDICPLHAESSVVLLICDTLSSPRELGQQLIGINVSK